jgi:hypothetical protein
VALSGESSVQLTGYIIEFQVFHDPAWPHPITSAARGATATATATTTTNAVPTPPLATNSEPGLCAPPSLQPSTVAMAAAIKAVGTAASVRPRESGSDSDVGHGAGEASTQSQFDGWCVLLVDIQEDFYTEPVSQTTCLQISGGLCFWRIVYRDVGTSRRAT